MSTLQNRVPAGVRTGGQYAATLRPEPDITLRPASHLLGAGQTAAVANSRHSEGVPHIELTTDQIAEVQQWVDLTGDFSYRTVRASAEEIYFRDNRYTPAEYAAYLAAAGAGASAPEPGAVRRDIEQMRKERAAAA